MTSENGTNRPDYSESDLIRSLGELPEETLQQLEQFPPALLETLTGLSPEARNSLLRMPLETLCQLSGIAAPTLEWLGRLVASSGPELLTQIAQLAKASPEAVLRLQEIPDQALEMLSVLSSDVLMSLIALPPDQLANLPLVIRALGETVDEGDIPSRDSSALGEVPPHLIETLDLFSPEAVQLLSKFESEAVASLSQMKPEHVETLTSIPGELLQKLADFPTGMLSTVPELSADEVQSISQIDSAAISDIAAGVKNPDPPVSQTLFMRLGMIDNRDESTLGRLVREARTMREFQGHSTVEPDPTDAGDGAAATPTVEGQAPKNAAVEEVDNAGIETFDDDEGNSQTLVIDDGGREVDDPGATVQSEEFASVDDEGDSDPSYGATLQADDLSDFSHIGKPPSEDSDENDGATIQSGGFEPASDISDEVYEPPMQPGEDWSADGISVFDQNDDASSHKTVQSGDFRDGSPTLADGDDNAAATMQSDEGWSEAALDALDRDDDDSDAATIQSDSFDGAAAHDDDSYAATIQSDSFDGAAAHDDDSYAATIQSDSLDVDGPGYGATIASGIFSRDTGAIDDGNLTNDESNMKDAWKEVGPSQTQPETEPGKRRPSGGSIPNTTLVITTRKVSTQNIRNYNRGRRPPEPTEPEYELVKVLGEGGMGIVFTARQRSIDRDVAFKMLKPKTARDRDQRAKFLSEAVVTGELDHPNIVPIYDVGATADQALFYSMKKVQGIPWLEVIRKKSTTENLDILMRSADAVAFAHSRGVIHRDLKPENTMLGEFGEVLVMDWGLAYSTEQFSKSESVTASTSMGGTPAYMAPEMATGPVSRIGPHSDVYLLGAILFEIITRRPPHAGRNAMKCLMAAARNQIRETDQDTCTKNDPTGELMEIALKAMETRPADRFQTVQEFQAGIREYQSHRESVTLSSRAASDLKKARQTQDYQDYSKALFAYEEAYAMWSGNAAAAAGIVEARFAYAASAESKGDFDLGMSLLDQTVPEQQEMYARLKAAAYEREARTARIERMKKVGIGLVALILVIVSGATYAVNEQRKVAVIQKKIAEDATEVAEEQKSIAEKQKTIAQENLKEAVVQRRKAVTAKEEAVKAQLAEAEERKKAEAATIAEKKAKDVAVKAQLAEVEERQKAEAAAIAEKKAKDVAVKAQLAEAEERQKAEAAAIAEAKAKDRALYQAYVASIGLADSQIRENAFDAALSVLKDPKRCRPDLRNWEWGRLWHLCRQGKGTFDQEASIDAIAISPDGSKFVTGGWDGRAVIWDRATGKPVTSLAHGGDYVLAVDWSPGGEWIVTGSDDRDGGYIQLWNARTGERVKRPFGVQDDTGNAHVGPVLTVQFSPDGQSIISGSDDSTVRLWNVSTGDHERLFFSHLGPVWDAEFDPSGKRLVTASGDGTAIVWDVASGEAGAPFTGHDGPVYTAAFSPTGPEVATGGYDRRILLWNPGTLKKYNFENLKTRTGKVITDQNYRALDGHSAPVRDVQFTDDGNQLVSGSDDNTVRLWSMETLKDEKTFRGHNGSVRSLVLADDDTIILTASKDHRIREWNIDQYAEVRVLHNHVLDEHRAEVLSARFSPDGTRIVTASKDRSALTWDASTGARLAQFSEGHQFLTSSAVVFPNEKWIATSAADNSTRVWDLDSTTELFSLEPTGRAAALAVSSDGKWLLTGSEGTQVGNNSHYSAKVWNVETRKLAFLLTGETKDGYRGHLSEVTAVAFSSDGQLALTGDVRGRAIIWDLETRMIRHDLQGHSPRFRISAVAFSADGSRALTASFDRTVAQWNVATGVELSDAILRHEDAVTDLKILKGDSRVVTTCRDGLVRMWNLADVSGPLGSLKMDGEPRAVSISDDGSQAVVSIEYPDSFERPNALSLIRLDGKVLVAERTLPLKFQRQLGAAVFVPGIGRNRVVVLGGAEARLLDVATGNVEKTFSPQGVVASASFSTDGRWIVTASWDHTARIWDAATGADLLKLDGRVVDPETGEILKTTGHQGDVRTAVFSPDSDSRFVLTAGADGRVIIWDRAGGKVQMIIADYESEATGASFSADGHLVLTSSADGKARIWDVSSLWNEEAVKAVPKQVLSGHQNSVLSASFSADSRHVVTTGDDDRAIIWDTETGDQLYVLSGHTDDVTAAAFSPSGDRIVTASNDNTVKIWDTRQMAVESDTAADAARKEILTLDGHSREVTSVMFSPDDGRYILTGSVDGKAILWLTEDWETIGQPDVETTTVAK